MLSVVERLQNIDLYYGGLRWSVKVLEGSAIRDAANLVGECWLRLSVVLPWSPL